MVEQGYNINAFLDTMESQISQIEKLTLELEELKERNKKILNDNKYIVDEIWEYKKTINKILNIKNGFLKLKSLEDVYVYLSAIVDFIFKLKEYNIYNINDIINYIEKTHYTKKYDNIDNINDIITEYHIEDTKKKENKYQMFNKTIINKTYEDKYFTKNTINENIYKVDKKILDFNEMQKALKSDTILKNTKIYNLKIYVKNIPIIIEYQKYEKNNFEENQLIPYFDMRKYIKTLTNLLKKYNLSFIQNNFNKKVKNNNTVTGKRNKYTKRDNIKNINCILEKISKNVKNTTFYKIKVERNKTLNKLYSYLYNDKEKLDKDEILELKEVEKIDLNCKNKSRFNNRCKIYDKIYNNNDIFSSQYILLPSYIDLISDKYIDLFLYKLELLCKGKDIDYVKNIENTEKSENKEKYPICEECGFEIDKSGCVCPNNCKNPDCENYDEDEENDLCKKCIDEDF